MSDFLGNLAARSLGRLETLQPRLPSRFEPAGSTLMPAPAAEGAGFEREAAAAPLSPRASAPPRDVAARPEPVFVPRAATPPAEGREWRSPRPEPIAEPAPRPRRRTAPAEPASEAAPDSPAHRLAPQADRLALPEPAPEANRSSLAQDPHPRPSPDHPIPLPGRGEPGGGRLAVLPLLPVGGRAMGEEGRGDEDLGRGISAAAGSAPSPQPPAVRLEPKVILAPPARAAVPPRTPAREPRRGETPAPAIQVTIGRLEVRATKAPAAAANAAVPRPAAAIPLQEYLDRRSRGGQR